MKGINMRRFSHYKEALQFMRDLKIKGVYNFSRCRLFDAIKKSSRFLDIK
jgi:hypothetical protein